MAIDFVIQYVLDNEGMICHYGKKMEVAYKVHKKLFMDCFIAPPNFRK